MAYIGNLLIYPFGGGGACKAKSKRGDLQILFKLIFKYLRGGQCPPLTGPGGGTAPIAPPLYPPLVYRLFSMIYDTLYI